jgi:cytochrome b561
MFVVALWIPGIRDERLPGKFFGWVLPAAGKSSGQGRIRVCISRWRLLGRRSAHVIATFYHQWVLRDGLLSRMWPSRAGARVGAVRTAGD